MRQQTQRNEFGSQTLGNGGTRIGRAILMELLRGILRSLKLGGCQQPALIEKRQELRDMQFHHGRVLTSDRQDFHINSLFGEGDF